MESELGKGSVFWFTLDFGKQTNQNQLIGEKQRIDFHHLKVLIGDVETMRREAHSIKGGAANLTAQELSTIAAELETQAKTGILENGNAIVDRLEWAFHGLEVYAGRI